MSFLSILTTIVGMGMSFGYFAQTIKIIKRKSAQDVSLITYLIFGFGIVIWLLYGISIKDTPIILSNIAALLGALSVMGAYGYYKKK